MEWAYLRDSRLQTNKERNYEEFTRQKRMRSTQTYFIERNDASNGQERNVERQR